MKNILAIIMAMALGCSSESDAILPPNAHGPIFAVYEVGLHDYSLDPPVINIPSPGAYLFHATNFGSTLHSFEVRGQGIDQRLSKDLTQGDSDEIVLELSSGTYDMFCPIANHQALGMVGKINVASLFAK